MPRDSIALHGSSKGIIFPLVRRVEVVLDFETPNGKLLKTRPFFSGSIFVFVGTPTNDATLSCMRRVVPTLRNCTSTLAIDKLANTRLYRHYTDTNCKMLAAVDRQNEMAWWQGLFRARPLRLLEEKAATMTKLQG